MPGKSAKQQAVEQRDAEEGETLESQYHPAFAKRATDFCMLSATNDDLARLFKVHTSTISRWIVEIPAFAKAVARGREEADAKVAKALFHRARGYSHRAQKIFNNQGEPLVVDYIEHYPPDTNAAALWLSNRQRGKWSTKDGGSALADGVSDLIAAITEAADRRRQKAVAAQPGDGAKAVEPLDVVVEPAVKDQTRP